MSLFEWSKESLKRRYSYYGQMYHPDLTPTPELSYILGVRYGDLNVSLYNSLFQVKDEDFAEEFAVCVSVVMGREYEAKLIEKGRNKGMFGVTVSSKIFCDFFKLSLEDHKKWVEPDYPAEFIRGFMDSDGSAHEYPYVSAGNTYKDVLDYISWLLKKYSDISSRVITPPSSVKRVGKISHYIDGKPIIARKVLHTLYITGLDNVERFFWEIEFAIARKMKILERGLYVKPHPIWEARKRREGRLD